MHLCDEWLVSEPERERVEMRVVVVQDFFVVLPPSQKKVIQPQACVVVVKCDNSEKVSSARGIARLPRLCLERGASWGWICFAPPYLDCGVAAII